jgi:hypothetical protein
MVTVKRGTVKIKNKIINLNLESNSVLLRSKEACKLLHCATKKGVR